MSFIPIQNLQTDDNKLRLLIDQINNKIINPLNVYMKENDVNITDLKSKSFSVDDILVNKDGAVLTSKDGEVLISG